MQAEAQILLGRLEQAWDTAVARGSASPMLRVIKMPADLSGLDRRTADRRAELWPLPDEALSGEALSGEALSGEALSGEALSCGTETAAPAERVPPGPLTMALRQGRDRAGRKAAI